MALFRSVVWFSKGMLEYTKQGFEKAQKSFNPADLEVDLSTRAIMITGANSGIGKVTALEGILSVLFQLKFSVLNKNLNNKIPVAKRGATVHMVCRSKERGEAARQEIVDQSKNQVLIDLFQDFNLKFQ
jgi:dehydrogenase/reductase SDR family protein 12